MYICVVSSIMCV